MLEGAEKQKNGERVQSRRKENGKRRCHCDLFFPSSLAPPSPLIRPVPRERRSRSATEPCMRPIRRPHLLMGEGDAGLPVAAGESGDSPTGPQSHLFRCFPSACEIPGAILPRGCGRIAGWSVCSLGIHHHPAPCRSAASLIGPPMQAGEACTIGYPALQQPRKVQLANPYQVPLPAGLRLFIAL